MINLTEEDKNLAEVLVMAKAACYTSCSRQEPNGTLRVYMEFKPEQGIVCLETVMHIMNEFDEHIGCAAYKNNENSLGDGDGYLLVLIFRDVTEARLDMVRVIVSDIKQTNEDGDTLEDLEDKHMAEEADRLMKSLTPEEQLLFDCLENAEEFESNSCFVQDTTGYIQGFFELHHDGINIVADCLNARLKLNNPKINIFSKACFDEQDEGTVLWFTIEKPTDRTMRIIELAGNDIEQVEENELEREFENPTLYM